MFHRFLRSRRGNVALVVGISAVMLIGVTGLAVDGARLWLFRSRLANALDAAAIASARSFVAGVDVASLRPGACAVFWANFGQINGETACASDNAITSGFLGGTAGNPTVAVSPDGTLTVSVTASVNTVFARVFGASTVTTSAGASALRGGTGTEIALALDVTGSMYPNDKMNSLRNAARDFVTSLYGNNETLNRTWVSVVPYTTHVNLGTANYARAMVSAASLARFSGLRDTRGQPVGWSGCVEARYQVIGSVPGDLTDAPPASDATRFTTWYYPSSLNNATPPASLYSLTVRRQRVTIDGDNDWRSFIDGVPSVNARAINEWALNFGTPRQRIDVAGPLPARNVNDPNQNPLDITGPNLGCLLESRYQILPLTAAKTTILNRIQALQAEPWQYLYRTDPTNTDSLIYGGTIVHVGLHAAWTTISPNWTGRWSDSPQTPALPLPNSESSLKVIVLMTDGVNDYSQDVLVERNNRVPFRGGPQECTDFETRERPSPRRPNGCGPNVWPPDSRNYTLVGAYGPYGRLAAGNLAVTDSIGVPTGSSATDRASANAELDRRLARLCAVIKQSGVRIYTVGFDISSAGGNPASVRTLLRGCATTAEDYFDAANASELNSAFREIANRVGRIRLVR